MPDWVVSSLARHTNKPDEEYVAFLRGLASRGPALDAHTVVKSLADPNGPGVRDGDTLHLLFDDLVRVWKEDTMASSFTTEICTHWGLPVCNRTRRTSGTAHSGADQ